MNLKHLAAALATIACIAGTPAAFADRQAGTVAYRIVDKFNPGGEGGWDFLAIDGKRRRLYVTRGDNVQVIDADDGKLVATLSGLHGTHGVALAGDVGFITNGKSNSVTVFDLDTGRATASIDVTGERPDAIIYEPADRRVYVMSHAGGNITVIDAATLKVVGTIAALPALEVAVTDGKGRIFVNSESENKVAVIDVAQSKMVASWSLAGCDGPTGLAIDVAHERLFSACANRRMAILDAHSGKTVATVPIGVHPDGAAFDEALGLAYSSNGDGTLTVVREDDPAHFHIAATLPTQEGARTMCLDPDTHRIYLPTAEYGPAPQPTAEAPKPRKPMLPGSFRILVAAPASH